MILIDSFGCFLIPAYARGLISVKATACAIYAECILRTPTDGIEVMRIAAPRTWAFLIALSMASVPTTLALAQQCASDARHVTVTTDPQVAADAQAAEGCHPAADAIVSSYIPQIDCPCGTNVNCAHGCPVCPGLAFASPGNPVASARAVSVWPTGSTIRHTGTLVKVEVPPPIYPSR